MEKNASSAPPKVRRPSFTRRIFLRVIPMLLGVVSLLGVLNYAVAKHHILAGVQRQMDALTRQSADTLAQFFRQRHDDALTLADIPPLRALIRQTDSDPFENFDNKKEALALAFARFAARTGAYSRVAFWDKSGRERVAATADGPAILSAGRPPIFSGRVKPGEVRHTAWTAQDDTVHYLAGVFNEEGQFRGGVVLTCDMARLSDLLQAVRVGEEGRVFIVDENNELLLATRPPLSKSLSSQAEISGTPWSVKLMASPHEFLRSLKRMQVETALLCLAVAIGGILWIIYWVKVTVRPIVDMAESTRRLAAGEAGVHFDPPPVHELSVLGQAFNDLSLSLQDRSRQLESRIRLLTAFRDMDRAVIQHLDEESILRTCLKAVAEGLRFDRTALYWVDHDKKEIFGRYAHGTEAMGFPEQAFKTRRVPLGAQDILNEVIASRASALVKEPTGDVRVNPNFVSEAKTKEFVMAPICGKDRVFGVLTADNCYTGRPLEESDKEGITFFANAVGLALENARLFVHLAESEARYRTLLENSPVAIVGLSKEHWVTTWNRGAELIFGYTPQEIIGKPLVALFPQGASEESKKLLAEVMEKGGVRDYAISGVAKGGKRLDLSLSWGGSHPDFWMNHEWTVVVRDVTEGRKLQHQLIRSEKLSAVGQLISGIAHELNNPLQAVVGYAQLLWEETKGMSFAGDLRLIFDNAMRCRKIIDNLLLFVRQGEVKKQPMRVPDALRASMELLDHKLKKNTGIRLEVTAPAKLPKVKGDFQQIQQVFVNLINNACDAMSGWQGPKELKVTATTENDVVRVEFQDSGPGIPEEAQAHVFEPFFTTKAEGHGTGLGLPVCRQIIEEHGGRMGFYSFYGRGATFWVELPVTQEKEARARAALPELPRVPGKLVLLVDDEPVVLSFLQKVLEGEGDVVETATSLSEAVSRVSQMPFDLVVTDVGLGKGTGLDLHDGWSRWTLQARPPFLFVTGDIINSPTHKTLEKRGLPVMHKPLDLEGLQRAVRSLLAGIPLPDHLA